MKLLCLDTSTAAVTVALVVDGVEVAAFDREVGIGHGELLATAVSEVLASGLAGSRPDAVAVGLGPGPFTSLRVGLATAAALADAWSVPCYGACSLDLLAAPDTVVVQDARRKEVYTAEYDGSGARVAGPAVMTPMALVESWGGVRKTVVGAGAFGYASVFTPSPDAPRLPRAGGLWDLVSARLGDPGEVLTPLYLRRPDAVASTKTRPSVLQ